jgi:3-hydroxyacyl-CoA dehydrogenase
MILPSDASARHNVQVLLDLNQSLLGIECSGTVVRPMRRLGIVGAGLMGRAIAGAAVAHGMTVTVSDVSQRALSNVRQAIQEECAASGAPVDPSALHRSVRTTTELRPIGECDLVIESVPESRMLKRQVYGQLEPHLGEGVVLGTNTSTIPIGWLAGGLADPSRFCGTHFFPIGEQSLVEIVRGPSTSAATLSSALTFVRLLGKIPLVLADGPGFLVNRLMLLYVSEAMELLMEGASVDAVDRAAEAFGMAMGPLCLVDTIGLDTTLDCAWSFCGAFPDIVPTSPLLVTLVKGGRLGRKSLAGFYRYEIADGQGMVARTDPAVEAIIARWATAPRHHPAETIALRLFLAMVLEAIRIIESGVLRDPRLIDLGAIRGLGFPESRGGLLYCADALGLATIVESLRPFERLGRRFEPAAMLLSLAREGRRFYDLRVS